MNNTRPTGNIIGGNMVNDWIFYTVKREYRKRWIKYANGREVSYFPEIPNKKDLVFKLLDLAQKSLKQKIRNIKDQDRMINCEGYGPWTIKGNKTHHKRMIPVYRGYKKTYLKQKQSVEEAIEILKVIFKKEWN
jgi:hypothetical protein